MNAPTTIDIKHPDQLYINGEWVKPSSDSKFDLIKASTEEKYFQVSEAQADDVLRAIAAAREAFDRGPWPRMSLAERAGYLRAMTDYLMTRAPELAQSWSNQVGAVHSFAQMLVPQGAGSFRDYADIAENFEWVERHPSQAAHTGLLVREPVGVVAAIVPWNSPLSTATVKIAPPLIAGCTVILKSAPETPLEGYIIAEAAEAVGLPRGVLNVVTAGREVSELLVTDHRVDKVTFTGSSGAGKRIASLCGERIARYTLELGGKSAAVILDDYEPGLVAEAIAGSTCVMANQVCCALTRIVVPRARHGEYEEAFRAAFSGIKVGDPMDPETQMGPLAMDRQRERVESYIAKGKAEGATLAVGGGRPAHLNRGYFVEPTVFSNVSNSMTIAQEEIFGPVVALIPADNEQHAIDIANDTVFGLNNAVFTHDIDRAYAVGRQLRSGTVGQNGFKLDFSIAFGGFKQSGIGREGGREGLLPFLEAKTMLLDGLPSALK